MNHFELKISPNKEMISIALEAAKAYASQYVPDQKDVGRLVLSLEEAIANVLNYSLTDSVQDITIRAEAEDGELKLSVIDKGLPGDYEDILKDEDALGLTIMHHSVDRVNVLNLGFEGRCQELIKYYSYRPNYEAEKTVEVKDVVPVTDFEIMPMRREDALMVGRGIYAEYGFSYYKEMTYYPEQLYAATRKGKLYSAVAVTPDGKAVGHLAAWEWDDIPGVWESGMAVTDAACRGSGVFGKLLNHIIDYVETQTDGKLHLGTAVTFHPFSQKGAYRYGSRPYGFVFNYHTADYLHSSSFKEKGDISERKDSYVYMGWCLDKERKTVYAVPEVKEILEGRYKTVGAQRDIVTDDLLPEPETSECDAHYRLAWHYGRLCIFKIGRDIADCLRRELLAAKRNGLATVELCLSMDKPGVSGAYKAAKELGFFFTGLLPGSKKGDIMLMDLMLSNTVNYDQIHVHEGAAEFLEQIRALDPDQQ